MDLWVAGLPKWGAGFQEPFHQALPTLTFSMQFYRTEGLQSRATGTADDKGINRVIILHSWPVNPLRVSITLGKLF